MIHPIFRVLIAQELLRPNDHLLRQGSGCGGVSTQLRTRDPFAAWRRRSFSPWSVDWCSQEQGLVNVPIVGDWFHITFPYLLEMKHPQ